MNDKFADPAEWKGIDVIEACHPDGRIKTMAEIERAMIEYALARHKGSISAVARALGMGRSTLHRKLDKMGLHAVARRGEGWHSRGSGVAQSGSASES